MYLSDRRGGHRFVIEVREQLDGAAEFVVEHFTHECGIHRWGIGTQPGERLLVGENPPLPMVSPSTIDII